MKNKNYSLEDLLADREFIKWVNNPTKESNLYWESLINNHPEKETFLKAHKIALSIKFKEINNEPQLFNRTLNNILNDRFSKSYKDIREQSRKIRRLILVRIFKAAAILFFVASLGAIFFINQQKAENDAMVVEAFITKQNPKGQKSTILLPDSSKVILNAESSISYQRDFKNNRTIELSGEAYFEVTNRGDSKFVVKTGSINVVVLGTAFNVRSFHEEEKEIVSLHSGTIVIQEMLDERVDQLVLVPGEKMVYDKTTGDKVKFPYDKDFDLAWKDGILAFQKSTLYDFVNTIERWYDVKVNIVGAPDDEWMISGRFNNETLKNILESLKFARKINYTLNKDSVTLNF